MLFDFRSLSSRHSSPAITVPPEAMIGSNEPLIARTVATQLSVLTRSSSRYRDTSSRE